MESSAELIKWILENLNYWVVTLFMTIESSFIPFPSEVIVPPAAWKSYAVHPPTTRPHTRRKDPAGAALAPPGQWHNAVLSSIPTAAVYPDGRKCADTAPIPDICTSGPS